MLRVATGIIIKDKKILLLKRAEQENFEAGKWCPVNETIEQETPEQAVVRGVQEEIGVNFTIKKKLFEKVGDDMNKKVKNGAIAYVFLGTIRGKINPNPKEVSEYRYFTYPEALRLTFAFDYIDVIKKLHNLNLI
ncbi:NUDIX hydrolase [archaeon]|nr:NUDIX hydrolase [archaeon]